MEITAPVLLGNVGGIRKETDEAANRMPDAEGIPCTWQSANN